MPLDAPVTTANGFVSVACIRASSRHSLTARASPQNRKRRAPRVPGVNALNAGYGRDMEASATTIPARAGAPPVTGAQPPWVPAGPEQGALGQTVAYHRDPLGFLRRQQARYGEVFSIRLLTVRPLIVAADADAVAALMGSDPASSHAGEARRRLLPFASPRSVFGGDAGAHLAARRRIEPAFSLQVMEERRADMARIARRHLERWPRGRPFRLLPRIRTLLDEIFVRLVLGVREEATAMALVLAMRRMLWTPGNPPMSLPGEGNGAMGAVGQLLFERRQAPLRRALAASRRRRAVRRLARRQRRRRYGQGDLAPAPTGLRRIAPTDCADVP